MSAPTPGPTMRQSVPRSNPSFSPWRPWEGETKPRHQNQSVLERVSPLKFTVEEPRTEVDPPATPPGESEPQRKVELFSATSIRDQGDSAHVMQADVGGAGNYGDSGVEADLCALSMLDPEEVEVLSPEPDLAQAENVEVHQKPVDIKASFGDLDCSNGNPTPKKENEEDGPIVAKPFQVSRKCPGKRSKKREVVMSFGMLGCAGGAKQM